MTPEFFLTSILLGMGLAMDAFSVSLANGLNAPCMKLPRMSMIAGIFAGFQAAMPLLGWVCIHTIAEKFNAFQKVIPWIALILLCWIGGKMLWEGLHGEGEEEGESDCAGKLTLGALLVQGVATSIDALSVGFTIANYTGIMAVVCALLIAVVTFGICMGGLYIGKKFGTKLASKASILGGAILIGIGFWIFFS